MFGTVVACRTLSNAQSWLALKPGKEKRNDMLRIKRKVTLLFGLFGMLLFTAPNNAHAQIILGDADGNGTIDIVDALLTAQVYVGHEVSEFIPEAADVNCDDTITIVDALLIAQYYVGLIEVFECHQTEENEWGFFIFLNADNNLTPAAEDDLLEMTSGGSTEDVKFVSLYDRLGVDMTGKLIYITTDGYDEIEDWGETDMGDWQTLADFGKWAVENYPANRYALILWNHGDGWRSSATEDDDSLFKAFSYDETSDTKIYISNGDYAAALSEITTALGRKLDIIGFDACMMGMWEVAVASAPYADYLLASEEKEPESGWVYDGFMPGLVANPLMTPEELGISIIDSYHDDSLSNDTLSLVDLSTLDELNAAISHLAVSMMAD